MNICEIFYSIQGESTYAGLPCVFIRTSGCNLRCSYCDTKYAYDHGTEISIEEIIRAVESYQCPLVEITGGEPLVQKEDVKALSEQLLDRGYKVLLETNGSISVEGLDDRIVKIMDIKCPDSGMSGHVNWGNLELLNSCDQVKFVISSRRDYDWAKDVITRYPILSMVEVLISTAFGKLHLPEVVSWILHDHLKVRFQLQLHKYIWGPEARGV